jgi:hypothetical protein
MEFSGQRPTTGQRSTRPSLFYQPTLGLAKSASSHFPVNGAALQGLRPTTPVQNGKPYVPMLQEPSAVPDGSDPPIGGRRVNDRIGDCRVPHEGFALA